MLNVNFFRMLSRKLIPAADVFIATDDAEYYAFIRDSADAAGLETVSTDLRGYSTDG